MSVAPLHRPIPHRRVPHAALLAATLGALATLGACAATDPYTRQGIWQPSGVNDANLAAMVVDPTELWYGRERTQGTLRTPTRAVERLWQGTPGQGNQQRSAQAGGGGGGAGGGASGGGMTSETTR